MNTSILVYAHDKSAGIKNERAKVIIEAFWDLGLAASASRSFKSFM